MERRSGGMRKITQFLSQKQGSDAFFNFSPKRGLLRQERNRASLCVSVSIKAHPCFAAPLSGNQMDILCITSNIPERQRQSHRRQHGPHAHMNKGRFKLRSFVERTIAWLKSYHRLRYRYERKRCMFQAMVDFACLLIGLRRVEEM